MKGSFSVAVVTFSLLACGGTTPRGDTTSVTIGGRTLQPQSSLSFGGDGYFAETVVMITDHPSVCGEIPTMNACNREADLYDRRTIDPPSAVSNSIVLSALGTTPGTYAITPACYFGSAAGRLSFVAHDAGEEVLRDEAVSGTIHLDEVTPGSEAAGSYDVVLRSGTAIRGTFRASFCSAVAAFAMIPPNRICSTGGTMTSLPESCTCRGARVSSNCTRASVSDPWTCTCTGATGAASTCTLPAAAVPPTCFEQQFTCCPMRF